jgi:hypothetical protein
MHMCELYGTNICLVAIAKKADLPYISYKAICHACTAPLFIGLI